MIRPLLLLCLLAAFGGAADARKPPKPPPDGVVWTHVGTVAGVVGNYTPVVQMGGAQIRVYANTNGSVDGNLYLRVGSWSSVGSASMVLDIADPRDTYIRTSGIAQGASGTYYAVLYTGDGYPTQGGYSPSWATSPDGYAWTWHGPITIFGRNQSSAMNLIVDESRTDAYRFMFWMDLYPPSNLVLVHSADGMSWSSDGLNIWPIAGEQPQFVSAARTPYGYHLVGADRYDGTTNRSLRHAFSCDGLTGWHVIETASDVGGAGTTKGTNLVYDAPNNQLHALTSGVHWQITARSWGC